MTEHEDEYTGIFDHLTPADFEITSSAVAEAPNGDRSFDDFVDDQLRALRYAFAAATGQVDPLCTLASPNVERVFAPDDDETLGQYIKRLNREARNLAADWVFIFQRTIVGEWVGPADEAPSPDSNSAMELARANDAIREGVYWHAEDRSGDSPVRRHGYVAISSDNQLGDVFEANPAQATSPFAWVLGNPA
jgi:hypothetical protein